MTEDRRLDASLALATSSLLAFVALVAGSAAASGEAPRMADRDAIRLAEAYRLVGELGEEIWPGLTAVPFPVLLVTEEREFLVDWDGEPPEGFDEAGLDGRLERSVLSRPRVFSPGMEASFPAFGPPAVVVFGTAEATGRDSNQWVLTIVHEHLHQFQYAAPGYYQETEALGLSDSDPSGMWMLNYPFPYEDPAVSAGFAELARVLGAALGGDGTPDAAWASLRRLLTRLEPPDARYLSFQLWQEGMGRYIELRAAEVASASFAPSEGFAALADSVPWEEAARRERERLLGGLAGVSLADDGRTAFYPVGAALGVLLDESAPGWKSRYLEEKFALDRYAEP